MSVHPSRSFAVAEGALIHDLGLLHVRWSASPPNSDNLLGHLGLDLGMKTKDYNVEYMLFRLSFFRCVLLL